MHEPPRRMGGEFEIALGTLTRPALYPEPRLGNLPHALWTDTGRSALTVAMSSLAARHRGRVWIPALGCAAIDQAARNAELEICHYAGGLNETDWESLRPDTGDIVLGIHYHGWINGDWLERVPAWRRAGIGVIEDCVMAGLTKGVGHHGDAAVASFRKYIAIPDGALLTSGEPWSPALIDPDEAYISRRLLGGVLRNDEASHETFLPLLAAAEGLIDTGERARRRSWAAEALLARTDLAEVAARRIANTRHLYRGLEDPILKTRITPLLPPPGDGEVPLGVPIRVSGGRRDHLRMALREQGMYCAVHWPLDHLPTDHRLAGTRALADSMLTLPIDQRIGPVEIDRLLMALTRFFSGVPLP